MSTKKNTRLGPLRRLLATSLLLLGCGQGDAEKAPRPPSEYDMVTQEQRKALEGGAMPIDQAMAELGRKPRSELSEVVPRPSEDESALNGWSFKGAVAAAPGEATMPPECAGAADPMACWGQKLSNSKGCMACHAVDGVRQQPCPNWKGLHGSERLLASGDTVVADDEYLANSIVNSWDQIVEGYGKTMPPYNFPQAEVDALVAYLKSLGEGG